MESKRSLLVTGAFELFYQKGVHAVGINEVLQHSSVAKKTLYHHFTGKDDLVVATLEYRDQCFYDWLANRLNQAEDGEGKVTALFDALDDWFNDRVEELQPFTGCFFINVSGEYADPDCAIHRQCRQHKQRIALLIAEQLSMFIPDNDSRQVLLDALCILKEGAITLAHVQGDFSAAKKAKATALMLLK